VLLQPGDSNKKAGPKQRNFLPRRTYYQKRPTDESTIENQKKNFTTQQKFQVTKRQNHPKGTTNSLSGIIFCMFVFVCVYF
jgi:hypothetical protein